MKAIHAKLVLLQSELKAPKNQYNKFGKYNYRSAEDILEGAKPLNKVQNCSLVLSDKVIAVGDRIYVEATVTLTDGDTGESISVSALARESFDKKGMDDSQITGTASSYARKYALNGLYAIDDTKDADTDESRNVQNAHSGQNGQGYGNHQPQQNNGYNQPQMNAQQNKQNVQQYQNNQNQGQRRQNVPNQQHYGNQNQGGYQNPNNQHEQYKNKG